MHNPQLVLLEEASGLYRKGRYQEALQTAIGAARLGRSAGLGALNHAFCLSLAGLASRAIGNLPEAERLLGEARNDIASIVGTDHPEYATCVANLAGVRRARGRYMEAHALFEEALRIRTAFAVSEGDPAVYESRNNVAIALQELGRHHEAAEIYKESIDSERATLGRSSPDVAQSLNNLGGCFLHLGRYAGAARLLTEALNIRRRRGGDQAVLVAETLANLASLSSIIGDYDTAARYMDEALEVRETHLGSRHPLVARTLGNMAVVQRAQADRLGEGAQPLAADQTAASARADGYARALALQVRALDIRRQTLPADHPEVAENLTSIANILHLRGQSDEAERLYREALLINRAAYGPRHPYVAQSLIDVGNMHYRIGDNRAAEPPLREAVRILESAGTEENALLSTAYLVLAQVCVATGRGKDALELFRRQADADSVLIGQVFAVGSEAQRALFIDTLRWRFDCFLSFVRDNPCLAGAALAGFELVLRRKGIEADMLTAQRDVIFTDRYPELRARLQTLLDLRAQIARKTLDGAGPEGWAEHSSVLRQWQLQQQQLESSLAGEIPELDLQRRSRDVGLETMAEAMPADTALVELVRIDTVVGHASASAPASYLAFILEPHARNDPKMVVLDADSVDAVVSDFRRCVQAGVGRLTGRDLATEERGDALSDVFRVGTVLRELVFDPFASVLRGTRRVLLGLDGSLLYVPFAILPLPDGRLLLDAYDIDYVATGRDLLRSDRRTPPTASAPVVIADPDYDLAAPTAGAVAADTDASKAVGRSGRSAVSTLLRPFHRLPGTRAEGTAVSAALGVAAWFGAEALDSRVKRVQSPHILHVASHAYVRERERDSPSAATDVLGDGGWQLGGAVPRAVDNPLLRSGIALAGVNTWLSGGAGAPGSEDGILTAEDVTGMDLRGTTLVVLSACQTGLGEFRVGEGVLGFRRSFTLSGAMGLIVSLFSVPDEPTRELMEEFYRLLTGGQRCVAEALREAQRVVRQRYPASLHWGFFIFQGDPRIKAR